MDGAAAETTQDWLLPEHSRPPLIGELEQRVELALAIARASEAAVMTVGAAAIDAAEQARRAAEVAEQASVTALAAQDQVVALAPVRTDASAAGAEEGAEEEKEDSLSDFSARADRLVARLRQLQRVPLPSPASSDPADRPQSAR